jgi:hypothetical protein
MKAAWALHPLMDDREVSRLMRTTIQQRSRRFAVALEHLSESEAIEESRRVLSDYEGLAADAGEPEHQAVYARLAHY